MTAPSGTSILLDGACAHALDLYRSNRVHGRETPIQAARRARDAMARSLADSVLDDPFPSEFMREAYRVARAIHDAVTQRGAFDRDCRFQELTAREQFWNTGKVGAA